MDELKELLHRVKLYDAHLLPGQSSIVDLHVAALVHDMAGVIKTLVDRLEPEVGEEGNPSLH